MEAVDHDPAFAKKAGIPQSVGAEFVDADKAEGRYQPKRRGTATQRHALHKHRRNRAKE